jgi:hypothetical protein
LAATKHWRLQNIGVAKMLASTKYCRRKKLASTKHLRQQNISVDKILASTESRSRQNVGACKEASPYCFGSSESAAADFSLTSPMLSYFSLKMLCSPSAVTKCAVAAGRPAFMGRLSPTLYRLICTGPPCRKYWRQQNIGDRQDFTEASYQKLVKTKSDHHHCFNISSHTHNLQTEVIPDIQR